MYAAGISYGSYLESNTSIFKAWSISDSYNSHNFIGHKDCVEVIGLSKSEKWIASGSKDKTARLWDTQSGDNIHTFQGHNDYVVFVDFTKDENFLITGGLDNIVNVWDISSF